MRLIDADKLTELCDIMADKCDGIGEGVWHQFKTTVEWSPTIDAEPVRHGKWEDVQFRTIPHNRIAKAKKCSECGKRKDKYTTWNYCPICGAKMDLQ